MNETKQKMGWQRYLFIALVLAGALFIVVKSSAPVAPHNPLAQYNQPIHEREAIAITIINEMLTTRDESTRQFLSGQALEYWDSVVADDIELTGMSMVAHEDNTVTVSATYSAGSNVDIEQEYKLHFNDEGIVTEIELPETLG